MLAFALCVLFYAVLAVIGFDDIEEDAFIYFRFAQNIADGHGYVFNVGGERIEACSGLLWLGLLTVLVQLPLHIVLATKLLCFLFGVLCLRSVFVLSQRFIQDRFMALLPPFLVLASIPFYTWSLRGLETAQYWFVMLWLVDWVTNPSRVRWWWLPALAVMNSRPEGFLMIAAVLPYLYFWQRDASRFWWGASVVCVGFVLVTGWRFWYFHDLVPHPFYFKVNPDHGQSLKNLLTYGWHSGWWLLLLLALPGVRCRWHSRDIVLLGALLLSLLWSLHVFEDKVFNRHTGMVLPFFYVAMLMLLARWLPALPWLQVGTRLLLCSMVVFTLVSSRYVHFRDSHPSPVAGYAMRALDPAHGYWQRFGRLLANPDDFHGAAQGLGVFNIRYNYIASVGDFVRLNYRDDVVVVYDQIGQAPWYAGQDTVFIDNLGLGDRAIGLSRFARNAASSTVYGSYEAVLSYLVRIFWPEEKRSFSDQELLQRLREHDPDVIIARKSYLRRPDSLLARMLRDPVVEAEYSARYLLNQREIVFERISRRQDYRRADQVQVPPLAVVQPITVFRWCEDGSACITVAP